MRALIRGTEICLENAWSKWQRMNMLFLTGKEKDAEGNPLPGDGWTLVEDYQEPVEGSEEPQPIRSDSEDTGTQSPVEEKPAEPADGEVVEGTVHDSARVSLPETVTYGGKEYTLEELKKLIG